MKKLFIKIFFLILSLAASYPVNAIDKWNFPLERTLERQEYKTFGQYIDQSFYVGKDNLFPNKFYGYHAGADLEIFSDELNKLVSVYAIHDGEISFIGDVSGYGGVILEKLNGNNLTALYGHLKLATAILQAGDKVTSGKKIADLGNAFSSETAGERKHLHFGIYRGTDNYFKGYENTETELQNRWLDPIRFLKSNNAVSLGEVTNIPAQVQKSSVSQPIKTQAQFGIVKFFLDFIKRLLKLKA